MTVGGYEALTQYARLVINGQANMAGWLEVDLVDDFMPAGFGEEFQVITFAGSTGAFVNSQVDLGEGVVLLLEQNPLNIILRSSILA